MRLDACNSAPVEWDRLPIERVCSRITSGGTPSRKQPDYYEGGNIPWLKTKELSDTWIEETEEHISEAGLAGSSAKWLAPQSVIMAMYGATVGKLGLLARKMTCNQACCVMEADEELGHYRYLFYQLLNARPQIEGLATGAAQQNLSAKSIKEFVLPFPPLPEQRAIASILGALDDKIEANRKIAATLEEMARAIFTSWFVRFDPVRAKADGRQPEGMDAATAALFPDRFVPSELGEVPEGWGVVELGDVMEIVRRSADPRKNHSQQFLHYSLPAFDKGQLPTEEMGSDIKSIKTIVPESGVLLSKLNPRIPRIWLPSPDDGEGMAVCSTEFVVCQPTSTTRNYLYGLVSSDGFLSNLVAMATGTSGSHQRVPPKSLVKTQVLLPPMDVTERYEEHISPVIEQMVARRHESRTLTEIRDTLLPKLMSGEVRLGK